MANEKFSEIFGYTQEDLIGKPALTLVDSADEQTVRENLRKRAAGEQETINYTWTGVHKNGAHIDIEVQGGAIEFNEESAVMGLLLDVTRNPRWSRFVLTFFVRQDAVELSPLLYVSVDLFSKPLGRRIVSRIG